MKNFKNWLKISETTGTGAIYDGSGNTEDYQWWGSPEIYHKKKKKKRKKKNGKLDGHDSKS